MSGARTPGGLDRAVLIAAFFVGVAFGVPLTVLAFLMSGVLP